MPGSFQAATPPVLGCSAHARACVPEALLPPKSSASHFPLAGLVGWTNPAARQRHGHRSTQQAKLWARAAGTGLSQKSRTWVLWARNTLLGFCSSHEIECWGELGLLGAWSTHTEACTELTGAHTCSHTHAGMGTAQILKHTSTCMPGHSTDMYTQRARTGHTNTHARSTCAGTRHTHAHIQACTQCAHP